MNKPKMRLVIGLGNHGDDFRFTRHNIGYMCVDRYAWLHKLKFKKTRFFDYAVNKGLCLIKPKTFMNRSGNIFPDLEQRWQIEDVLAIHDDIEIAKNEIRIRSSGGDGGHNGVKSLLDRVGKTKLRRIRIGIGKRMNVKYKDFVLEQLSLDELNELASVYDVVAEFIEIYAIQGYSKLLDYFSQWKKAYSGVQILGIVSPEEEYSD
ncbi:MAG: aminoacyl-tRNA hydrolase [Candidatus Cloacimonetes bacterium]|nr:aminoacyl-tRNA hydrolase [Candidatus Cloacimonadota bacterium]